LVLIVGITVRISTVDLSETVLKFKLILQMEMETLTLII